MNHILNLKIHKKWEKPAAGLSHLSIPLKRGEHYSHNITLIENYCQLIKGSESHLYANYANQEYYGLLCPIEPIINPSVAMTQQLLVYVPPHPLIKHWLAVARDVTTPSTLFRTAITELGRWLTYEAVRDWLPTQEALVQTPLASCASVLVNPEVPIAVVPILRAGLGLLEGAQAVLPVASIYHLGLARNEETLEPICYLNKLPEKFQPETLVLITEPMLATGGSIMVAMSELTNRGVDPALIRIVSVVAARQALQRLNADYSGLVVYTAAIDEKINDQGFIVPGLGDAGDRIFGT